MLPPTFLAGDGPCVDSSLKPSQEQKSGRREVCSRPMRKVGGLALSMDDSFLRRAFSPNKRRAPATWPAAVLGERADGGLIMTAIDLMASTHTHTHTHTREILPPRKPRVKMHGLAGLGQVGLVATGRRPPRQGVVALLPWGGEIGQWNLSTCRKTSGQYGFYHTVNKAKKTRSSMSISLYGLLDTRRQLWRPVLFRRTLTSPSLRIPPVLLVQTTSCHTANQPIVPRS
ncbi:hypothetical protein LX36DRAFT_433101 [Colletotrichum falcatum]|nr:hypothetical protein LX36DRAFT_433101 [Colletotrichum falcatum]